MSKFGWSWCLKIGVYGRSTEVCSQYWGKLSAQYWVCSQYCGSLYLILFFKWKTTLQLRLFGANWCSWFLILIYDLIYWRTMFEKLPPQWNDFWYQVIGQKIGCTMKHGEEIKKIYEIYFDLFWYKPLHMNYLGNVSIFHCDLTEEDLPQSC